MTFLGTNRQMEYFCIIFCSLYKPHILLGKIDSFNKYKKKNPKKQKNNLMGTKLLEVTSLPPALVWLSASLNVDKIQPIPINYHDNGTDFINSLLPEKLSSHLK